MLMLINPYIRGYNVRLTVVVRAIDWHSIVCMITGAGLQPHDYRCTSMGVTDAHYPELAYNLTITDAPAWELLMLIIPYIRGYNVRLTVVVRAIDWHSIELAYNLTITDAPAWELLMLIIPYIRGYNVRLTVVVRAIDWHSIELAYNLTITDAPAWELLMLIIPYIRGYNVRLTVVVRAIDWHSIVCMITGAGPDTRKDVKRGLNKFKVWRINLADSGFLDS
ncbi:hypothetical protein J6590_019507 [Homalodisca vitripennis]|nr:hypothetical protein J6590_019507 [Homalodisca vitripennis]